MAYLGLLVGLLAFVAQGYTQEEILIFEENFDVLDTRLWKHELTFGNSSGNFEFQRYGNNRTNSYTRDGILYIKPTLTIHEFPEPGWLESAQWDLWGNLVEGTCTGNWNSGCYAEGSPDRILYPIESARLRSGNRFQFRFGRIETRAQMPRGDWLWPAIWMMPAWEQYGDWPVSGEIDIVESRGNDDLSDFFGNRLGNDHAAATLHWGPYRPQNQFFRTSGGADSFDPTYADDFHIYEVEWTEEGIIALIDGEVVMTALPPPGGFYELGEFENLNPDNPIDNPWRNGGLAAPFDREFYFILNVAVGGTVGYFPDDVINGNGPKPWRNDEFAPMNSFWEARDDWLPTWRLDEDNGEGAAMKIDYIRVYQTPEQMALNNQPISQIKFPQ